MKMYYILEKKPLLRCDEHHLNLRNRNSRTVPKCRLSKYQKSFFPFAIKIWNNLDTALQNMASYNLFKNLLCSKVPKDNPLFHIGSRQETILMAKLRMNCSSLAADLFELNIIESATCRCGHDYEDSLHYFFVCPIYRRPRAALHAAIIDLAPFTLRTLLYGNSLLTFDVNSTIIMATISFINNSKRFS